MTADIVCCRQCSTPLRGDVCPADHGHSQEEPKAPPEPSMWERATSPEGSEAAARLFGIACPGNDGIADLFGEEGRARILARMMSDEGKAAQKQLVRILTGRKGE